MPPKAGKIAGPFSYQAAKQACTAEDLARLACCFLSRNEHGVRIPHHEIAARPLHMRSINSQIRHPLSNPAACPNPLPATTNTMLPSTKVDFALAAQQMNANIKTESFKRSIWVIENKIKKLQDEAGGFEAFVKALPAPEEGKGAKGAKAKGAGAGAGAGGAGGAGGAKGTKRKAGVLGGGDEGDGEVGETPKKRGRKVKGNGVNGNARGGAKGKKGKKGGEDEDEDQDREGADAEAAAELEAGLGALSDVDAGAEAEAEAGSEPDADQGPTNGSVRVKSEHENDGTLMPFMGF
ncbi:hypothetical protein MBLNU230_g4680t1 [Neophaeotheca triangularis]